MLYEVRDPFSNIKGYLLGAVHDLSFSGISWDDASDIFGPHSETRKCFERSSTFASELRVPPNLLEHPMYEKLIREINGIDFLYGFEAYKTGKKIDWLDREEVNSEKQSVKESQKKISLATLKKCEETFNKTIITGSEELLEWRLQNCESETNRFLIEKRNHTMAEKTDFLLRQPGISFLTPGMLHLPGDQGICNLLRKRGWDVQRVGTPSSEKSII